MVHKINTLVSRANRRNRTLRRVFDLSEFFLATLLFPASLFIIRLMDPGMELNYFQLGIYYLIILLSWFVMARVTASARVPRTQRYLQVVFHISRVSLITALGLMVLKIVFRFTDVPFSLVFTYVAVMTFSMVVTRLIIFKGLKKFRENGRNQHYVLVVADAFSDNVIENLIDQKEWGFRIHGLMTNSKLIREKYKDRFRIYSEKQDLKRILDEHVIDEVIHCKKHVKPENMSRIANICNETGVLFRMQSGVSPLDPVQFQLKTMANPDEIRLVDNASSKLPLILKYMGDMYFSIIALIMLAPVFLMIGLIIKIDSRGPVFFLQERIGLRGRKFKVYKFRTMVTNAEALLAKLEAQNEADGPVFKIKKDPRITRIGAFLRKTGLDELPQLINVVRGEMSLIGPRPPLEKEVKLYERWQLKRLSVKPGITCTWQVEPQRHDVSFERWMELDIGYINNWSLSKDLGLFFKTLRTFVTAGGH